MASNSDDLSTTIEHLNAMLDNKELSTKDRLAITDRLLKAYALQFRWKAEGKGGKFQPASPSTKQ